MRDVKIYCDRCGEQIKLETGSETQLSGQLISFHRKQVGSWPTVKEYEVCWSCGEKIENFIKNK